MKVIQIIGGTQKHQARRNDNVVPCLTSSMGCGGGYVPMIVIKDEPINISFIDLTRGGSRTKTARCLKARYDAGLTNRTADNSGVLVRQNGKD